VKENDEIRRRVGYLSRDPRYYEYMTARQTLCFTASFFYEGPRAAIEQRVAEALDLVGLADKADRPAYVLAKLIAHGLGLFVAWVALPGVVGYLQLLKPAAGYLTPLRIAGVMGLNYLNLLFFLTLALMLATFFNGRGPVLGISLVLAWAGPMPFLSAPIQRYAPWLYDVLPWKLLIDFETNQPLARYLANGQPLPTVVPIIATALWCVLFTAVAIWRVRREEF
jgi:hypothetical protein